MANKVKFGLSNCYYSVYNEAAGTYGTPVAMPGAVNLSLDQEGETTSFRADNTDYYISVGNNGYTGELELALIPDSFMTDVMGETVDGTNGLQFETAGTQPKPFALLFQFQGDNNATRHILYYCKASRPTIASQTTEATIEPVTETLNITATPLAMTVGGAANTLVVKAKCVPTDGAYTNFFTAVQKPTA